MALHLGGSLRLFVDVRLGEANPGGYPDGLAVALAPLRNGLNHAQVGERWLAIRDSLPANEVGAAARRFYDEHYDISASQGIPVPPAEPGEPLGHYADRIASSVLRREMPQDTAVDLHSPNEVDAPGTRFYHLFPADNAQVIMGWLARGRVDMAMRALENETYQQRRLGYAPNFTARIAMLRTQTSFESVSVDAFASPELYGADALRHFRPALEANLKFWNGGRRFLRDLFYGQAGAHRRVARLPTGEYAYRNWDDSEVSYANKVGMRPESAEEDWSLGEKLISGIPEEEKRGPAWEKMIRSLLAACESFQDMSDYQLVDPTRLETTRTTDILPSWLQATMAHKYKMVALAYESEGNLGMAEKYWRGFNSMKELLNNRHWRQTSENEGHYTDLLLDGTQLETINAAQIMPLLIGDVVPYDRARMTVNLWRRVLLGDNGLKTSPSEVCNEQWSGKRDWPALATWAIQASMQAAVDAKKAGQDPAPFLEFADDVRVAALQGMQSWYNANGTIPERINDTTPTEVAAGGEYCKDKKTTQHGFGMSIGSIRVWQEVKPLEVELDPRLGSAVRQVFAQTAGSTALAGV
jgi:alpha,alpha-trehalase